MVDMEAATAVEMETVRAMAVRAEVEKAVAWEAVADMTVATAVEMEAVGAMVMAAVRSEAVRAGAEKPWRQRRRRRWRR